MEHLEEVKKAFSKYDYVLVVITTPNQNTWREGLARVVGKARLKKYSDHVHAWLVENASAWELVNIEAICPKSGITGFAVAASREGALADAMKIVIETARTNRDDGIVNDVYAELGATRRAAYSRS